MGNDRFWKNQDTKARQKSEHSAARWALERFRQDTDPSGFPDLRRWISNQSFGEDKNYYLGGFRYEDIRPRLTEEEYNAFEAAYRATPEGQADKCYKPYEPKPQPPEKPGSEIL